MSIPELDRPLRRLQSLKRTTLAVLGAAQIAAAASVGAALYLLRLAGDGRVSWVTPEQIGLPILIHALLAGMCLVALLLAGPEVAEETKLLWPWAVRSVLRSRLDRLTPAGLLALTGKLHESEAHTLPHAMEHFRTMREADPVLRARICGVATLRAAQLGLPAGTLNLVRDHIAYDGPVSDLMAFMALPTEERLTIVLYERRIRQALGNPPEWPHRLTREVMMPLVAASADRRSLIANLVRASVETEQSRELAPGLVQALSAKLEQLDKEQLDTVVRLSIGWSGDPMSLVSASATL